MKRLLLPLIVVAALPCSAAWGQVAVRGAKIYTMAGPPIENGVVVIQDGKISAIGVADQIAVPKDYRVLEAAVVTPGLVDAHSTVGFAGIYNQKHDQDQLEHSAPCSPSCGRSTASTRART